MIKQNGNTIHLMGKSMSYVMYIDDGDLLNFHFHYTTEIKRLQRFPFETKG